MDNGFATTAVSDEFFYRQRRNLMVAASIVLAINVTGVKLSVVNLLGNQFTVDSPERLPSVLLVVLLYFFVRFFQFLHDIPDTGINARFHSRAERHLEPRLFKRELRRLAQEGTNTHGLKIASGLNISRSGVLSKRAYMGASKGSGEELIPLENRPVFLRELLPAYVVAGWYIVFRTRLATDFMLPIALAVAALVSFIWNVPPLFGITPIGSSE